MVSWHADVPLIQSPCSSIELTNVRRKTYMVGAFVVAAPTTPTLNDPTCF